MWQGRVPGLALAAHGLGSCLIAALVITLHELVLPDLGTRTADLAMVVLAIAWLGTILFIGGLLWGRFTPVPTRPGQATSWVDGVRAWARGRGYPAFALGRFGIIAGALTGAVLVLHGTNALGTQDGLFVRFLLLGVYSGLLAALGSITTEQLRAVLNERAT